MKGTFKELFTSKKFYAALSAFLGTIISHFSGLSSEMTVTAVSGFLFFIGAQGIADHGKEKEKIRAANEKDKSYVLDNDIEAM